MLYLLSVLEKKLLCIRKETIEYIPNRQLRILGKETGICAWIYHAGMQFTKTSTDWIKKCYNDKLNGKYIAERLLYWAFGLEKSKL